jgi:hypothetical protein
MRSEFKFCAAALALAALAAPMAISQTPATPTPDKRILPTAAAGYAEYQGEVSNIMSKELKSASELDKALNTFGGPNPAQLSSAWISYSAILAAQNKEFVDAVRDIDSYYGRERVMTGMRNDVGYARTLKGGEAALQSALAINSKDTARISSAGAFVKEQSYKLQNVAWGKSKVKDPTGSIKALKASANAVRPVTDAAQKMFAGPDLNAMLASVAASPSNAGSIWDKVSVFAASAPGTAFSAISPVAPAQSSLKVDPKYLGTANRMVTLAAFHAIEADKSNANDVKAAMTDSMSVTCLEEAQMQLLSCVSAAHIRSDLTFCLARHGLKLPGEDVRSMGGCFSEIAK